MMKSFTLLLTFVLFTTNGYCQNLTPSDSIFDSSFDEVSDTVPIVPIFSSDESLDFVFEFDVTSFIRQKNKSEYIDANLIVSNDKISRTKSIRLKARGNFRKGQCFFPPIALNFKTDPIEQTSLEGVKKIKLVTHCNASTYYSGYILKEFLVYKLYNVLTDYSFRVKFLNIKYIDTGKKQRNYEKYGFLIEPLDVLAKRTESTEIKPEIVKGENLIEEYSDMAAMFQYMIGNSDWRQKGGHNTRYVKSSTIFTEQVIPIPYDFDFSGFVGTHYSFPQEWVSIENTKQREYMGYCREDSSYYRTVELFLDKKEEFYAVINDFKYLDKRDKEDLLYYLDEFFMEIQNPTRFVEDIKYHCRPLTF